MIVRDEEANLPRCFESMRGAFDEIVVVDTGSVDRTAEEARRFGPEIVIGRYEALFASLADHWA